MTVHIPYILGSHTVIHPCAKILAETGPIVIGENNLIEENVTIINKYDIGSQCTTCD